MERIESQAFQKADLEIFAVSSSAEALGLACFSECRRLSSVGFESGSRLSRTEGPEFRETGLVEIVTLASVEVLDLACFYECKSLSSVILE
jgi:hypothetical protein